MMTDNFCFYLQNRLIQTSQIGGQWYRDISPVSIPCHNIFDCFAECHSLQTLLKNAILLNVILLYGILVMAFLLNIILVNVILLNSILLNVILSVVILNSSLQNVILIRFILMNVGMTSGSSIKCRGA
jgi:hypothetical protein